MEKFPFPEYILYILAKELRHTISKKKSHTHTETCFFQRLRHIIMKKKETRPSWDIDTFAADTQQCNLLSNIMFNTWRTIQACIYLI